MKSLMSLWSRLAEESASQCCTSATRDIKTVTSRVEHEGLSFLTITLPTLGKAFESWLDQGKVSIHPSFSSGRRRSLPLIMGGFFARVFDADSGLLLNEPCIDSIRAIRQLTLMFGKIELECSQARQLAAVRNYVECEQEVRLADSRLSSNDFAEFTRMSAMLFQNVFDRMDRDVYYGRLVPKHGPGSTADGLTGNGKYSQAVWTDRLEAVLPAGEYLLPNWSYYSQLEEVDFLEPGSEVPVKVTLVPKTLKTPRVIAMEPTCMQYMQQAILCSFLEHFGEDDFLPKVIGFDDQVPNQELACQGSFDQRTATLDLSDASDRVSNQLVRAMLSQHPHLLAAVDATRSRRAELPGTSDGTAGEVIRLAKFASMGSALCFPVEAMVFTTLIFLGIQRSLNTSLCRHNLFDYVGSVRVYGDDLIVPVDQVHTVVQTLEHFGAQVGMGKSFWSGRFRESCGKEYFNGHDVSLVRVRQAFPTQRQDVTEVQSLVSLRNQLYMSGYWKTVRWLDDILRKMLNNHFPVVLESSSVLGRISFLGYETQRVDPNLQSPLVRGWQVEAKPPQDHLEGAGALLKCLLKLDKDTWLRGEVPWYPSDSSMQMEHPKVPKAPEVHSKHLERSGRPKSSNMKLRWRSPL
uniref:RNA-directed RNA polymerase n=1 Tax=Leviviridae sp. TaxID=2027243 RepID=A0A514D4D3_9VIRU|nr:MAG: RNA-dependent RNA polymerase [Leviviridae sp.]